MIPLLFIFFALGLDVRVSRYAFFTFVCMFIFLVGYSVCVTPLLMSPMLHFFERCLVSNPNRCRSKQGRYQLSQLSPYLVTHLPAQPPTSLLSHPSSPLAIYLPTYPPVSLLSHPSSPLAIYLPTQPPISLLSHPPPFLATHHPTKPPISLFSHPSPYLAIHLPAKLPISLL